MSEFRKDPFVGRWVIIATERARRPGIFIDARMRTLEENTADQDCPFCHNQETEIYALPDDRAGGDPPSWRVKVVPHGTSLLKSDDRYRRHGHGPYDVTNAYGKHEVVIETPEHIANMADLDDDQIRCVFRVYAARFQELRKNRNLRYAVICKNYGWAAGSRRIGHARSQVMAAAVTPILVKEKLKGAKRYFDYHDRCLYCDMIRQEMEDQKRIVAESEHFLCVTPFACRFPFELLLLPKAHHCDFSAGIKGKEDDLARILKDILTRFKVGLDDPAYNFVIQTSPYRRARSQAKWQTLEEDYHWHIEIVPRLARPAGFEKGSGFYICPIPPEAAAEYLREVDV